MDQETRAYPVSDVDGLSPSGNLTTQEVIKITYFKFENKGCLISSEKCFISIFAIRNTTAVKFYYRPISQFPQNHRAMQ